MKTRILAVAGAVLLQGTCLMATPIPYPSPGTEASTNSFYATGSGNISAYFYASDAGYDSNIGLLINGVSTGIFGLPNHSSNFGQPLVLGCANAGDLLAFELRVLNINSSWFSDRSLNSDNSNHVYTTPFSGIGGVSPIPAGIYLGFEDLPFYATDVDYNDHQFVVTNVSVSNGNTINVPDHGSTLFLGMVGIAAVLAAKEKNTKIRKNQQVLSFSKTRGRPALQAA